MPRAGSPARTESAWAAGITQASAGGPVGDDHSLRANHHHLSAMLSRLRPGVFSAEKSQVRVAGDVAEKVAMHRCRHAEVIQCAPVVFPAFESCLNGQRAQNMLALDHYPVVKLWQPQPPRVLLARMRSRTGRDLASDSACASRCSRCASAARADCDLAGVRWRKD